MNKLTQLKRTSIGLLLTSILAACGGSEPQTETQEPEQKSPVSDTQVQLNAPSLKLATLPAQARSSSQSGVVREVANGQVLNASGEFKHPQPGATFEGNISTAISVTDTDGIARVLLGFDDSEQYYILCEEECDNPYDAFVTGISPQLFGAENGELALNVFIDDGVNPDLELAITRTINWQGKVISGVSVSHDTDAETITVSWSADSDLLRYNVYIANDPNITSDNVTELEGGEARRSIETNTITFESKPAALDYYILVSGVDGTGESAYSGTIILIGGSETVPPTANNDSFTVNEDEVLTGNVLTNDSSNSDEAIVVNLDSAPTAENGQLVINQDGSFSYTPNLNFNGTDQFTYEIVNEAGLTSQAVASIVVNPINDAPTSTEVTFIIEGNSLQQAAPGLLSNAIDIDGDELSVSLSLVSLPTFGTIQVFADGQFSYSAGETFVNYDLFQFQITDGTEVVTVDASIVTADFNGSFPAIAVSDTYATNEDTLLSVSANEGLLANDFDEDGDINAAVIAITQAPSNGNLIFAQDGSFTYTPAQDFFGQDLFQYSLTDGDDNTTSALVNLTVEAQNDAPVANNDAYSVGNDITTTIFAGVGLLRNDSDVEGDAITVDLDSVVQPSSGSVEINTSGRFVYTPAADFVGTDSFTYQITDGQANSNTAVVSLNVFDVYADVNDNEQLVIALDDLSSLFTSNATLTGVVAQKGTATFTQDSVTYTPTYNESGIANINLNFESQGENFTYTVKVRIVQTNQAPELSEVSDVNVDENIDTDTVVVTLSATDPESHGLTFSLTDNASKFEIDANSGEMSLLADASINFETDTSFSMTVSVTDEFGLSDTLTFSIAVNDLNESPSITSSNSASIDENPELGTLLYTVTATDPDTDDSVSYSLTTSVDGLQLDSITGAVTVSDTSVFDHESTDAIQISLVVTDSGGLSDSVEVTLTVNDSNEAPSITAATLLLDDVAETYSPTSATDLYQLSVEDADENETLTWTLTADANFNIDNQTGVIEIIANAVFDYESTTSYTLTALVTDSGGLTDSIELTLPISNVNEAPTANVDYVTVTNYSSVNIAVLTNDTDPENDTLIVTSASANNGSVSIESDYSISYIPEFDITSDTITYTVEDTGGLSHTTTVEVTVDPLALAGNHDVNSDGSTDLTASFDSGNNTWTIDISSSVSNAFVVTDERYYPLERQSDNSFTTTLDGTVNDHEVRLIMSGKVHSFKAVDLTSSASATIDFTGTTLSTDLSGLTLPTSFVEATATYNGTSTNEAIAVYPQIRRGATIELNQDGTGTYFNVRGQEDFTWSSSSNQLVVVQNTLETDSQSLTLQDLLDMTLITQTEYDDYVNNTGTANDQILVTSVQNSITLEFTSNQVYYYDVNETQNVTYTLPVEFSDKEVTLEEDADEYRLYNLPNLGTYANSDIAAGNFILGYFEYTDGEPERVVAEKATLNADNSGTFDDLGVTFTWSSNSSGHLELTTDNNFTYQYIVVAGEDNQYAKEVYMLATDANLNEQLSALYFMVQDSGPTNAEVLAKLENQHWDSAFGQRKPDAFTNGIYNGSDVFGFIFDTTQADSAPSGENAAKRIWSDESFFQVSDWTWSLTDTSVEIIRYIDFSMGLGNCDPDSSSTCFPYQIRTWTINHIDATSGRIYVTEHQETLDLTPYYEDGTITYNTNIYTRLNYYTIAEQLTTASDTASVDEDNTITGINVVANDIDTSGGSGAILLNTASSSNGTTTNDDTSFDYTPYADFNGTDDVYYLVTDSNNGLAIDIATVTVNPINDAPTAVDDDLTIDEGNTYTVFDLTNNDSDLDGDSISITSISSPSNGTVTDYGDNTIDYTHDGSETTTDSFTYTITDGTLTATATVNITVNPVNDAPTFTTSTSTYSVDEGQSINIDFGATDAESNTITYSFSADASAQFSIDSNTGALTFAAQDYETPIDTGNDNSYSVTVTAADDGSPSESKTFTAVINVQNVNEAPSLTNGATSFNVNENQTAVATATASDVDASDSQTFSLTGTDASLFSIGSSDGVITFNSTPDFESPSDSDANGTYTFDVVVTDGGGLTDSLTFNVTLDDVNEAPTFTSSATPSAPENQTAITTVTATDPENDTLTFSKNGGADSEFFNVSSAGVVTFSTAPDFEGSDDADSDNVYEVQIDVVDASGSATVVSQTLKVTLTDANESPSITSGNTVSIEENSANGTSLYTPTVTDPEGDTLTWALSDGSGIFAINSSTGEVTVNDNTNLDFETNTTVTITLSADDGTSSPDSLAVTVSIDDLVENVELKGDATFGYSAVSTFNTYTSAQNNDEKPVALVKQSDGNLLHVVNHTDENSIGKIYVVRTSTEGKNDITYGVNGQSFISFTDSVTATKAVLDSSDNLYIIGYQTVTSVDTAIIIKLDSSGNLDTSFDSDGLAVVNLVASGSSRATDLLLYSGGSLFLAATGITSQSFETLKIIEVNASTGAMTEHYDDDALGGGAGGAKESNVALVENSSANIVAIGDHAGGAHNQIYMSEFDINNLSAGPVATGVADYSNSIAGNGGHDYVYSYETSHTVTDRVYIGGQTNANTPDRLLSFVSYVDIANVAIDTSFGTNGFYFYDADPFTSDPNRISSIAQDNTGNIVLAAVVEAGNYPDYYLRKLTSLGVDNQAGDVADLNTAAPNVYPDFLTDYSINLFIDEADINDNIYLNFTVRNIFSLGADLGYTAFASDGTESTTALRFASFSPKDETFYAATQLTKGANNGEFAIATTNNDGQGVGSTYSYIASDGFVDKTYHYRGHLHFNGGGDVDLEQIGVIEGADGDLIIANYFVGDIQIYKQEISGFADGTFVDPSIPTFTSSMVPTGMVYDSANDHIIIYGYDAITSDDLLLIRVDATTGDLYDPGTGIFTDAVGTIDLGGGSTDRVIDVLPQADGSMIVFGTTTLNVSGDVTTKLFMQHLNTDGSNADTTFDDNDGSAADDVYTFSLSSAVDFDAIDIQQTSTDQIFVVGNQTGGTTLDIAKFDLTAKALDTNFGTSGVSTISIGTDVDATGLVLSSSDALYLFGTTSNGTDYDGFIAEVDTTNGGTKTSFNGFTNQSGGQGYFVYDEGGNETIDHAIYTSSGQLLVFDSKTGTEGKVDIRMTLYDIETDDNPPDL